jgi:YidC/Oxa1 family membrane protein insertase
MDRTSWIAIIVCLVLMFTYRDIIDFFAPPAPEPTRPEQVQPEPVPPTDRPETAPVESGQEYPTASSSPVISSVADAPRIEDGAGAPRQARLENEHLRLILSESGGSIVEAELLQHYAEGTDPVTFNRAYTLPLLNIRGLDSQWEVMRFRETPGNQGEVVYTRALGPDLVMERRFRLLGDYRVRVEQTIYNQSGQLQVIPQYRLDLGAITSVYGNRNERRFVGSAWLTHSGDYKEGKLTAFSSSMFGMFPAKQVVESKANETIQWAALKTQFFAIIFDFRETLATNVTVRRHLFPELRKVKGADSPVGVRTSLSIPGFRIEPQASFRQEFDLYLGPKEYERLKTFPHEQDRILEFGWMRWISGPMLWAMVNIEGLVHNYGVAIIILTIILRAILWIPQTKANLSAKRMQAVAPLMKETQEKFKDNPEKLNKEMLKIYQDYGVNPVGGCLPLLIQFPIFLGFFYMLQGAVELRHESFLWIGDLAQPDTVFVIPGLDFPINLMPLIMAATMYYSMAMAPQPAGVDNPMMKVMKFMPLLFLLFCYNYASALSVYWTMQNVLSMVQMKYNLRHHPPTLEELKKEAEAKKARRKKMGGGFGMSGKK